MQNVFINYCLRLRYPHYNYTAVIIGITSTDNLSILNSTAVSDNGTSIPSSVSAKQNSKLATLRRTYCHTRTILKLFRLVAARYFVRRDFHPCHYLRFWNFCIRRGEILEREVIRQERVPSTSSLAGEN